MSATAGKRRWSGQRWLAAGALVLFLGPMAIVASGSVELGRNWQSADRSSAGLAPTPSEEPRAVVLAYAARAFNLNGVFAVHTWLATKRAGARYYEVHQVLGWQAYSGRSVVNSGRGVPDRRWYDAEPQTLVDVRGERAQALLEEVHAAVASYPHADRYRLWPGPNSNTFVAYVARQVPGLGLSLPNTAIGKDYLVNRKLVGPAPSGTGYQVSLLGLLGVTVARKEGVELNVLGLNFGADAGPGIKLPGIGRLGW